MKHLIQLWLGSLAGAALLASCAQARSTVTVEATIKLPDEVDGVKIRELSGLAYDREHDVLWAVSDKGELRGFKISYEAGKPKSARLHHSAKLQSAFRSAEGLALVPAPPGAAGSRLLVVFEDGPAAISFSMKGDRPVPVTLPAPLDRADAYAEANSGIEAVAIDSNGILLSAPEEALAGSPDTIHTIYFGDGRRLTFPTFQPHRSNIKAIEVLEGKRLLILERTRDPAGESTMRLRLIDPASCNATGFCVPLELAPDRSDAFGGNYEGLARLRGNYFAAVTDSKPKDNEETTLVFFRIDG